MTFWDYIVITLQFSLAVSSNVFSGLFKAICAQFDQLREDVYTMRNQFICIISSGPEKFSHERGIVRFLYETDDQFRNRCIYAYQFYADSMTTNGIRSIVLKITSRNFSIRQTNKWRIGKSVLGKNTRLAGQNRFIIEFYETLTNEESIYIHSVLRKYIPAHYELYILQPQTELLRWRIGQSILGSTTILRRS